MLKANVLKANVLKANVLKANVVKAKVLKANVLKDFNNFLSSFADLCFTTYLLSFNIFSGDGWDANDAKVVCRELGFNPEYEFSKAAFTSNTLTKTIIKYLGIGRIVSAKCNGEEKQLADCVSPSENCRGGLAKVICHGKT